MTYCFIIPCYNHSTTLQATVDGLLGFGLPIIVIDDGSAAEHGARIRNVCGQYADVTLLNQSPNAGKGEAVIAGIRHAKDQGYSHALQVDADGQHNLDDIPAMLRASQQTPTALVSGRPIYDDSVPKARLYGRYATHVWVWIETLSLDIPDSMCGFRIYPVASFCDLADRVRIGRRMDFDTEIMVRLYWRNVPVIFIPTRVIYPEGGTSNFQVWRDNVMISWMHTKLFFGMLWRSPVLLARKFAG
ncbi:glycosyltransferase family 2 protein [Oceanobacter kriegii]|uniref:glycosyltransferase family 2 protein n=1 Tax=Oceanobacter kriegii TaxID=64972 RepID=UPI000405B374|nr:glycosyltransferase family 2 protein [Oceanobacter kriegii]